MPTTLPPPNFPTTPRRRGQQQVLTILGSGKNNNKNNNNNPRYTPYQEGARTAVERLCQLLRQADDVVVVEPQQQHHEIPRELVKRLVVQLLPPSSKLRSRILWALSGVLSNCVVLLARTLFHAIHHHHNHHRRRHRRTNRSAHIPGFFLKDVGDGGIGTGGGGGGGVATASTSCVPPPRSAGHQLFRHEYGLLIGREDKDSVTVVHEAREESLREGGGGGDDDDNNNNNNVHSTTGRQQLVDSVWNQLSSESKRQYERQAAAVAAAARTSFSHQKHDDRFVGPTPQGVGTTTLSLSAVSVESGLDSSSASASSSSDLDDGAGTAPENLLEEHDVWCRLVESVQLEVVAKGPHLLGNKPFRLYRLPHNVSSRIYDTLWLRKTIEDEFRNLFEGKGEFSKCRSALSSCRVYTAQACSNILWLQLNVGQSQHDFTRGRFRPAGKKRAAPWAEYRAVLRCDGHHMAVSSTGPAASARLTQLVVASLENAIACDNGNPRGERGIHGFSLLRDTYCVDPLQMLQSTSKPSASLCRIPTSPRYATDPVSLLESTATGSLLLKRQVLPRKVHLTIPRAMRFVSSPQVRTTLGGQPCAVTGIAIPGMVLEYTPSNRTKRKAVTDRYFGGSQDSCTKRTRFRFDVSTSAASTTAIVASTSRRPTSEEERRAGERNDVLKCRIVLQGTDVFSGVRLLLESGDCSQNLPRFWQSIADLDS